MTGNTQPEALRLADWLQAAVQTYPQMSEDEPGGYASEVDQIMDEAAAELRRQHARIVGLDAQLEAVGAAPVKAGVCGEPQASGTVHRVDGPCYVAAPQPAPDCHHRPPCAECAALAAQEGK